MLYVIIPNYNGLEHLVTCYSSIESQSFREYKVILVDNGSNDASVKFTKEKYPDYYIILLDRNLGFAKAINEGVRFAIGKADCETILLLNNDIELHPEFMQIAVNTLKQRSDTGFLAVKMLNYYDRQLIDDCGDFIKGNGGSPLARGHGERDNGQYDREEYIFGACAGAAFYRKETFEKVGLFDESFFAYYEDIDFSFRAQMLGYRCYYQPKSVCYHKRGGTISVATEGFQTELCERNLVLLRIKNYPLVLYFSYQPFFAAARLKRYFSFLIHNSFPVFLKAIKGHIRGLCLLLFQLRKRTHIQNTKVISNKEIAKLFIK